MNGSFSNASKATTFFEVKPKCYIFIRGLKI